MTCLADCAAMRPYSSGGSASAMVVADLRRRIAAPRVFERDLVRAYSPPLDHQHVARQPQLALLRLISARTSVSLP
jgi:hypothetical protein